jgi:hypothetical protein
MVRAVRKALLSTLRAILIPIARVDPLPLADGFGWVFGREFEERTSLYGRCLSALEVLQSTEELDGKTRALSDRLSSSTDALSRFTEMESLESTLRPIRYRGTSSTRHERKAKSTCGPCPASGTI